MRPPVLLLVLAATHVLTAIMRRRISSCPPLYAPVCVCVCVFHIIKARREKDLKREGANFHKNRQLRACFRGREMRGKRTLAATPETVTFRRHRRVRREPYVTFL